MFELLFKYPAAVFSRGQFVFLAPWPAWLLGVAIMIAAGALAWHISRRRGLLSGLRPAVVWLLETALVALVLFLLWHPAISIATLRPQQNVVAVLIDDSRSMSTSENGTTRLAQAEKLLSSSVFPDLAKKFQVRLYRFANNLERIQKTDQLTGAQPATRIGASLEQVLAEASTLPLGAVVLLSDGSDNSGGIGLDTIAHIRQTRVPVHTIGFGREKLAHDVEVSDVTLPARALADSRLAAEVTFRQFGYTRDKGRLAVREGGRLLASREFAFKADGTPQTESLVFNAGLAGPRSFQFSIEPLPGEENQNNNTVTRLVNVTSAKPGILYMEGEPSWEYKFIRRGIEDDRSLQISSLVRTTQNKIYTQAVDAEDRKRLEGGFPSKADDLFVYDGLIIGSVEAGYFTPQQQELIREFVDRRGGGVLFLGGRAALADGGWAHSPLADLLPVHLPEAKDTFHRDPATAELTAQGSESLICRFEEDPKRNVERWKTMPVLADYQQVGDAKPGALTLLEASAGGRRHLPLLVLQRYGKGRTAVFATGGSWRWQMMQPLADKTHEMFWQQLLRWLVADAPGSVMASTDRQILSDESRVPLRVDVRDKSFRPVAAATVEAHIVGPAGIADNVSLRSAPLEEGVYTADWNASQPGSYMAEIVARQGQQELGRDVLVFRRENGVAENFHITQNRELLEKLADETGGHYYPANRASRLAEDISYSEAGITSRETKDLWDMPVVFLAALLLRGSEWLLRRKWGVV
ncbi:MAG TPA: glutamine amidotransferase [Bryobacteraceae bacterium]|nr:glutamine amidotransferase [Bryobacteraceae bacterium]